jgi:hypothetical protein
MPKRDSVDPNLPKLLSERDAPTTTMSSTESEEPKRARPKRDNEEPSRAKLRRDIDDPRLLKSSTDSEAPKRE